MAGFRDIHGGLLGNAIYGARLGQTDDGSPDVRWGWGDPGDVLNEQILQRMGWSPNDNSTGAYLYNQLNTNTNQKIAPGTSYASYTGQGDTSGGGNTVPGPASTFTNAAGGTSPQRTSIDNQFDLSNMPSAFRNAMRSAGFNMNPFTGMADQVTSRWAPAAFSQYAGHIAGGGGQGGGTGAEDLRDFLMSYIRNIMGQGGGTAPWSQGQAQGGRSSVADLIQRVGNAAGGQGVDISQLGTLTADQLASMGLSDLNASQLGLAGMLGGSPDLQRDFYAGSVAPTMNAGLMDPLNNILARQQRNYSDFGRSGMAGSANAPSFLDILMGNRRGLA